MCPLTERELNGRRPYLLNGRRPYLLNGRRPYLIVGAPREAP